MAKKLFLSILVLALVFDHINAGKIQSGAKEAHTHRRQKRFSSNCRMSPDNDEDTVIEEREPVTLECTFDDTVQSCIFSHIEPMNVGEGGDPDITCSAGNDQSGQSCQDDSRISYEFSDTKCAIRISDTLPEDTGDWKISGVGFATSGGTISNSELELFTYNRSTVFMYDEDDNDITNGDIDTVYTYNDRQEDWEEGYTNFESVEVICKASGGRPEPTFKWYVENNDNDNLADDPDNVFDVSDSNLGCEDRNGYICDVQSSLQISIDDKLMEKLEEWGVEVNNEDNMVRFEVNCEIEQGDSSIYTDKVSVEVNVEKRYDNGRLSSSTIGIIVGCICAGILLIIAICLLVYAKRTGQWCFAEDDYRYNEPSKQPRSHATGGHHQQQVHSEETVKDRHSANTTPTKKPRKGGLSQSNSPSEASTTYKKNKSSKPPSTTSSSTSKPKTHLGEWVDKKSSASSAPPPLPSSSPPPSSTTDSVPSTRSDNNTPPPRPKKPQELDYANLDRRSFMNDPRNRVLPPQSVVPRQSPTEYASIISAPKIV